MTFANRLFYIHEVVCKKQYESFNKNFRQVEAYTAS